MKNILCFALPATFLGILLACGSGGGDKKESAPHKPSLTAPPEPAPTQVPPPATQPGQLSARSRAHAAGCLLGLAVGDALGTTLEFKTLAAPAFPVLATGPHTSIVGGGPFHCAPGEVTDDTQMALVLARSLATEQKLNPERLGQAYVAWKAHAFDIGNQTSAALHRIQTGTEARLAGTAQWEASGFQNAANGSLMRTAPIGVFFAQDAQARREAAFADSSITHADPRCQLACAAFNAAIAYAVRSDSPEPLANGMWQAAYGELQLAAVSLSERMPTHRVRVLSALIELKGDLEQARTPDPNLYDPSASGLHLTQGGKSGFVRLSFRLAFWELMHAPSFQAALVDVVNRGGDADTNGAITGALLGARFGLSGLPAEWVAAVEQGVQRLGPDYKPSCFHAFLDQVRLKQAGAQI